MTLYTLNKPHGPLVRAEAVTPCYLVCRKCPDDLGIGVVGGSFVRMQIAGSL